MTILPKANAQCAGAGQSRNAERRRGTGRKEINLSEPYETGLAAVLSLSEVNQNRNQDCNFTETLRKTFRCLYEAANGRHVSTLMGPIAIAPAVAPWLKNAPLFFGTPQELCDFVTNLNDTPPARVTRVTGKASIGKGRIRA
jgi:hypothetical protein